MLIVNGDTGRGFYINNDLAVDSDNPTKKRIAQLFGSAVISLEFFLEAFHVDVGGTLVRKLEYRVILRSSFLRFPLFPCEFATGGK